MSDELAGEFRAQPDFREQREGGFELLELDFEGRVTLESDSALLHQELPTIDAAVIGDAVAPVVADGWFETFERRVGDVTTAISGPVGEPRVEKDDGTVHVRIEIGSQGGRSLAKTVRHAANYVEGTWVEGIIPGYEYESRVQAIRERAMSTGEEI